MRILRLLLVLTCFYFCAAETASAEENPQPRSLPAIRLTGAIKIDGVLDDEGWKTASRMDKFVEFRPKIGAAEADAVRTEAFLIYNDEGIYFGGFCHERTKDSIAYELKGRDGFGTNDYIGIIFDTYHDKLNAFEYFVTPLNEQWDAKMSPIMSDNGNEDFSWNGVWSSATRIHDNGWSFEMFIPYGAIRFGPKDVQNWGMNVTRRRRKTEQQVTWNPINPNVNGFLTQEGIWQGIANIKPPVRLQFSPYLSVVGNHFPANQPGVKNLTGQVNGGMDVKYGINQAFTLDMTLVPDFGQVQSDNRVLNLTPFEVQFNEYRTFFTEGTELFSKGNLFYSRRIGGTPMHMYDVYNTLDSNELVVNNPSESKLLNATKISGRTQRGLGIGLLNAITRPQYATIETTDGKNSWKYETNPLTNYNILVLDQTLKYNSSVSLINTNVMRSGSDYDANVTAGLFEFNNKKNRYNVGGKVAVSQLFFNERMGGTQLGYNYRLYTGKTSGRFNFNLYHEATDTRYTHNDLGYFTNNNFRDVGGYVGYRWVEPRSWYNRININFNSRFSYLYQQIGNLEPSFQRADINANVNVQMKKLHWFGFFTGFAPANNDFYEPRVNGYFFRRGASLAVGGWFESNASKKYSFQLESFTRRYFDFYNLTAWDFFLRQNFRFNQKFSLTYNFSFMPRFNGIGYGTMDQGKPVFGRRRVNTIENILDAKYSFSNMMWLTFRLRHYYSSVKYAEYFQLDQASGLLSSHPSFAGNADMNANFFNIDMVYTWQFAPGSFLNIVWKSAATDYRNTVVDGYVKNLGNVLAADQNNNLSVKLIYFLDYLQIRKWFN